MRIQEAVNDQVGIAADRCPLDDPHQLRPRLGAGTPRLQQSADDAVSVTRSTSPAVWDKRIGAAGRLDEAEAAAAGSEYVDQCPGPLRQRERAPSAIRQAPVGEQLAGISVRNSA